MQGGRGGFGQGRLRRPHCPAGISIRLLIGIAINSANAPGRLMPTIVRFEQRLLRPCVQYSHAPHVMSGLPVTRLPVCGPATMVAANSCPRIIWRRAPWIVTVIGVHVRSADANGVDLEDHFVASKAGVGLVEIFDRVVACVDEGFHQRTPVRQGTRATSVSFRGEAAIDEQRLSGDIGRRVAGEKYRDAVQVLQRAIAPMASCLGVGFGFARRR